jgi:hypothetical protein
MSVLLLAGFALQAWICSFPANESIVNRRDPTLEEFWKNLAPLARRR